MVLSMIVYLEVGVVIVRVPQNPNVHHSLGVEFVFGEEGLEAINTGASRSNNSTKHFDVDFGGIKHVLIVDERYKPRLDLVAERTRFSQCLQQCRISVAPTSRTIVSLGPSWVEKLSDVSLMYLSARATASFSGSSKGFCMQHSMTLSQERSSGLILLMSTVVPAIIILRSSSISFRPPSASFPKEGARSQWRKSFFSSVLTEIYHMVRIEGGDSVMGSYFFEVEVADQVTDLWYLSIRTFAKDLDQSGSSKGGHCSYSCWRDA